MCFDTTKTAKAKIAETDIECWKALEINKGKYVSCCEGHLYEKGVIQPIVDLNKIDLFGGYQIARGYHSCKSIKEAKTWPSVLYIRKFIIPKGTRYYSNRTEYVSETIMLVK